jgi:hypothetical protein
MAKFSPSAYANPRGHPGLGAALTVTEVKAMVTASSKERKCISLDQDGYGEEKERNVDVPTERVRWGKSSAKLYMRLFRRWKIHRRQDRRRIAIGGCRMPKISHHRSFGAIDW